MVLVIIYVILNKKYEMYINFVCFFFIFVVVLLGLEGGFCFKLGSESIFL